MSKELLPIKFLTQFSLENDKRDGAPNQDRCGFIAFERISEDENHKANFEEISAIITKNISALKMGGATFCGIIYDYLQKRIYSSNLGDSCAYAVFRSDKAKKILIKLTEDFSLTNERLRQDCIRRGGVIKKDSFGFERLYQDGVGLAMTGCYGDAEFKDILQRTPEINKFRYEKFAEELSRQYQEQFSLDKILLCSDGFSDVEIMLDKRNNPFGIFDEVKIIKAVAGKFLFSKVGLLSEEYKSGDAQYVRQIAKSKSYWKGKAQDSVQDLAGFARLLGSQDDISIAQIDVAQIAKLNYQQPVMAFVADGHGYNGHKYAQEIAKVVTEYLSKADRKIKSPSPSLDSVSSTQSLEFKELGQVTQV